MAKASRARRSFDRSIIEGPILPAVWKLGWPTMLQNVIGGLQGIVDHTMVGNFVGFTGNAAIGVSWQIFLVVVVFISSLFTGMGVLVARFAGRNEPENVDRTVYQAFLTAAFLSVFIMAPAGYFLSPWLLELVNAEPAVQAEALPYLRIMFVFSFGTLMFFMLGGALRSAGDARTPLRLGIVMTVLNIVLNAILILGIGPVPAFGTAGAAMGTVIAGGLVSVFALYSLMTGRWVVGFARGGPDRTEDGVGGVEVIEVGGDPGDGMRGTDKESGEDSAWWEGWGPDWSIIRSLFRFGLPTGIQGVAMNAAGVMLLRFIGSLELSAEAQAVYTVSYTQLFSFITWTSVGLMGATAAVAGQNLGAGRPQRTVKGVRVAAGIGLAVAMVVGAVFLWIPEALLGIFGMDEPVVLELGTQLLTYLSVSGLFITVALTYTGGLQGTGDTKNPLYISIVSQIVIPLGMCAVIQATRGLQPADIWLAIVLGHATRCALSFAVFRKGGWRDIRVEMEPARS